MPREEADSPRTPESAPARRRKKPRSLHTRLLIDMLPTVILIVGGLALYAGYLSAYRFVVPHLDKESAREYFLLWMAAPIPVALAAGALWSRRDRLVLAKRRLERGSVAKAIRHLTRIADADLAAARLLGDIRLDRDGGAFDPAEGAARYRAALDILDKGEDTPTRTSAWLRDMLGRIAPLAADYPDAAEVASRLNLRLKDTSAAIRFARMAANGGEPGRRCEALKAVLRIDDAIARERNRAASDDEPPRPESESDDTPGVLVPRWHFTRVEVAQALVFPAVIAVIIAIVHVFGPLGGGLPARLLMMATIFCPLVLIWWLGGTADRFRIGESHFLEGRYGPAARIFTKLHRKHDPRAAKRLGDMHAEGLGVDKSVAKARAAYLSAFAWMNFNEGAWDNENVGGFFSVPGYDDDPGALRDWYEQIEAALERFADEGDAESRELLVVMATTLGQNEKLVRYVEAARESEPSPENRASVLQARLEAGDESVLPALRRLGDEGDAWTLLLLARYYCGDAGHIRQPDRDKALASFRKFMALRAANPDPEADVKPLSVLAIAAALMDRIGPDAFTDAEIAELAALSRDDAEE